MNQTNPTADVAVNHLLALLLERVRTVLGGQYVGMYLYGSLASGDFNQQTSDVDFLVVTKATLDAATVAQLEQMHAALAASGLKWAAKLEGSYLALPALHSYDPADTTAWPTLNEGQFFCAPHGWDWVIQRHVLREHGVVVDGPPIRPLIDPVTPAQIRQAVRALLGSWWRGLLEQPERLQGSDYQAYAIISMCRVLHALRFGVIASKPAAARWAQRELGPPWDAHIERALQWQPDQVLNADQTAQEFIRYTLDVSGKND